MGNKKNKQDKPHRNITLEGERSVEFEVEVEFETDIPKWEVALIADDKPAWFARFMNVVNKYPITHDDIADNMVSTIMSDINTLRRNIRTRAKVTEQRIGEFRTLLHDLKSYTGDINKIMLKARIDAVKSTLDELTCEFNSLKSQLGGNGDYDT